MDEEVGLPLLAVSSSATAAERDDILGAARMLHKLTAVVLGASAALLTTSAFAQGTPTSAPTPAPETPNATPAPEPSAGRHPVSVELLAGFGFGNVGSNGGDVVNPYALGIGLRAGYTLPMNLYLGATFIYHLGYTDTRVMGGNRARIHQLGVESGYVFNIGPIVLRPFFGLGLGLYSSSTSAGGNFVDFGTGTKLALWPGVLAAYNITNQIFVGADIRYTIVTRVDISGYCPFPSSCWATNANAFGLYANGGYRF